MSSPWRVRDRVVEAVRAHCQAKGYAEGEGVNNFIPHDCIAAFQMARLLAGGGLFEHYVAIAPEGHIYGYFFERLGVKVLSVYTDYPPTRVEATDDLSVLQGGRVLLIEDDVIGGATLRLVVGALLACGPASLSLYLGHTKGVQGLRNVPREITKTYLAEDCLEPRQWERYEADFLDFFGGAS